MKRNAKLARPGRSPHSGFSVIELLLTLVVLLILTIVAVPVILRSLQSYQLNSAASQVSGILKFAKFEAIRQNTPIACQILQQGTSWVIWVDSNGNGTPDGSEPRMFIGGSFTLLPAATVPSPSSIAGTLGADATMPFTVLSGSPSSEWFDHRGTQCFQTASSCPLSPLTAPTIYAVYLGNPNDPTAGYRAIITLPSGAVQVWSAGSGGPWQRVS